MKDKKYFYMAEKGNMCCLNSISHEMVYRSVCYAYAPSKKVVVIDSETFEAKIYNRELDRNGNLLSIFENGVEIKCGWGEELIF